MASKMLFVTFMAASLICGVASATILSSSSSMDNMVKRSSEADMEKTFFHPFFPPYGLIGQGGPYLGGGILRGGGLGAGLGAGGFGGGLGNGNGDELGGRKEEHNGRDQNKKNGADAAAGADQDITP